SIRSPTTSTWALSRRGNSSFIGANLSSNGGRHSRQPAKIVPHPLRAHGLETLGLGAAIAGNLAVAPVAGNAREAVGNHVDRASGGGADQGRIGGAGGGDGGHRRAGGRGGTA